jgi:hypothetical protein
MGRCVSGCAAPHRPLRLPQPVQLRRQRPSAVLQILQVAVAVERPPVNAAGPAAPVAGLGGAWTGVVGLRPAAASVGLVEPRAGRDADLPGPARLPAAHEPSPPGLVAGLRPTHQAGGHGQAGAASRAHRTLRRSGLPGTVWSGRDPKATVLCPQIRSASGRPYAGALTRQVWPVDQAISPSPGASRDVAGGKPLGRQLRSRAGHATSSPPPWWCRARTAPQFAMGSAPLAVSRAWAGQADPSDRDATWGSASSVGIGRRLAPAQATLLEPCRPAPLDARLEAQHPGFERH